MAMRDRYSKASRWVAARCGLPLLTASALINRGLIDPRDVRSVESAAEKLNAERGSRKVILMSEAIYCLRGN